MDHEQQQRSWLKVYSPCFTNEEELLPGAVSARHNIPTGGVALASLGPFVSD